MDWSNLQVKKKYAKPSKPEVSGNKVYYSDWFITLNSNLRIKTGTKTEIANKIENIHLSLDHILDCTFTNPENFSTFLYITDKSKANIGPVTPGIFTESPKLTVGFEVGEKNRGRRVHAHALFQTAHIGMIRMDLRKLREVITDCFNQVNASGKSTVVLPNYYLDVKWVPSNRIIKNYIGKSVNKGNYNPAEFEHPINYWKTYKPKKDKNSKWTYPKKET